MDFHILVEDVSGEKMLEVLLENILSSDDNCKIRSFKGLGELPTNLSLKNLNNLLLNKTLLNDLYPVVQSFVETDPTIPIIIVCDLDNRQSRQFYNSIKQVLNKCNPIPNISICFAVKEGEAWLLGDINAIKKAYPNNISQVLNSYISAKENINGTWEKLADAVYPGGSKKLSSYPYPIIGIKKSEWAKNITPFMDVNINKSPSFNSFKNTVENLI